MACRIELINPKNNKTEKVIIMDDIYRVCEERISEMNGKLKKNNSDKYYNITQINI